MELFRQTKLILLGKVKSASPAPAVHSVPKHPCRVASRVWGVLPAVSIHNHKPLSALSVPCPHWSIPSCSSVITSLPFLFWNPPFPSLSHHLQISCTKNYIKFAKPPCMHTLYNVPSNGSHRWPLQVAKWSFSGRERRTEVLSQKVWLQPNSCLLSTAPWSS